MKKYLYLILFFLVCVPAIAGTINSYTLKSPPDDADTIVIYDSDDGSTKKTTVGDISSGGVAASGWTDGGANVYLTDSTDSVGIGTNTPSSKLQVVGSVTATTYIGDGSALTGISSGGWSDNGTNVVLATSTDNVGIGSTSPISALDTGNGVITSKSIADDQVYNVKKYGAKGDGITWFDGAITSGTDDFTSASATFTSADVGKVITITNAAGASTDLTTTIASYIDPNSITLTDNASASVSGAIFTYGTDDTTAIRAAVAAVGSASPPVGTVFFPQGIYIINGAFDQTDGAQIAVPTKLSTASPYFMTTVKFKGPIFTKSTNFYGLNSGGAILYSTRNGSSGNSVITGKGTGGASNFTDIRVEFEDLTVRTVQNPTNNAVDLLYINTAIINNLYIEAGTVFLGDITEPTVSTSYGLIMPGTQNNNVTHMVNVRVQGFYNGILAGEHTSGDRISIFYTVNGLGFSASVHNSYFGNMAIERTINNIVCSGTASFIIVNADMENAGSSSGSWYENLYDYSDPSSQCTGSIGYFIQATEGGSDTFTINGGKKVSIFGWDQSRYEFVTQSTSPTFALINKGSSSSTNGAIMTLVQDDGAATASGDRLGSVSYGGATNTTGSRLFSASISAFADETYTSSATGGHLRLNTTPIGSNSPVERLRVTSAGNVGIGTTTPNSLLQVGTTNSSAFRVTSGGNVGIGTTAPGATLDIGTGNLRVGIGTTTAGTLVCVKSISGGTSILGYCTGSLTDSICGTCN